MPDSTDGLRIEGLACSYGKNSVLTDVTMDVEPGQIVGLVGRNGAGKTTTLRCISGVVSRSGGSVYFRDRPLSRQASKVARSGIAHVPEGRGLFGSLTTEENLKAAAYASGHALEKGTLDSVVQIFPRLAGILSRRADVLSGGEQQMVALARALVARASMVLVDELSLGLAPIVVDEAWQALLQLRESDGLSLLVVDQNLGLIEKYCDKVFLLKNGSTALWTGAAEQGQVEAVY